MISEQNTAVENTSTKKAQSKKLKAEESLDELTSISKEITSIKKRGDPQVAEIQAIADRIWRASGAYERRVKQLDNEKNLVSANDFCMIVTRLTHSQNSK